MFSAVGFKESYTVMKRIEFKKIQDPKNWASLYFPSQSGNNTTNNIGKDARTNLGFTTRRNDPL